MRISHADICSSSRLMFAYLLFVLIWLDNPAFSVCQWSSPVIYEHKTYRKVAAASQYGLSFTMKITAEKTLAYLNKLECKFWQEPGCRSFKVCLDLIWDIHIMALLSFLTASKMSSTFSLFNSAFVWTWRSMSPGWKTVKELSFLFFVTSNSYFCRYTTPHVMLF